MPKIKSHSGAKKRLKKTGTGKLKRGHAGKSHLLTHKTKNRKRKLKKSSLVGPANVKQAKKLVPYL